MAKSIIRKTFKYRIYPSKKQVETLENTLDLCRELYNAALQERRDAWRLNRTNISFAHQCSQLPEIKESRKDISGVYAQVLQNVLHRVDWTHKRFFARCVSKEKSSRPRFKPSSRFNSFTYPQQGFLITEKGKLRASRIGDIKIKLHRPITGKAKTLTITRNGNMWFASFSVETLAETIPDTGRAIGIDMGIESFATLSDGTQIDNWKYYESAQKNLRVAQRRVARRRKGSVRRGKAAASLRKIHLRIANRRNDFQHKLSKDLINQYDLIAIESLNVRGMAKGMLSKQVNDVAWGRFFHKLTYKAESAGRKLVVVSPYWTSQTCSSCGDRTHKALSVRTHECIRCGLVIHRDHNAALNILSLGLSDQDVTYSTS